MYISTSFVSIQFQAKEISLIYILNNWRLRTLGQHKSIVYKVLGYQPFLQPRLRRLNCKMPQESYIGIHCHRWYESNLFFNAFGDRYIIFLDPVGFIENWSALFALVDEMGHYFKVFCSFYVFPSCKEILAPTIRYTSMMNSLRMSLMRLNARIDIMRTHWKISNHLRQQVRLKSKSCNTVATYVTKQFNQQLFRRRQEHRTKT